MDTDSHKKAHANSNTITNVACTHHAAAAKRIRGFGGVDVRKFRDTYLDAADTRFMTLVLCTT